MVTALFVSAAHARTVSLPSFDEDRRRERPPMAVPELNALKRSVDQLRETLGEAVLRSDDRQHNAFTYDVDQQVDNDFWPRTEHSPQHPLRHGQKDHWKRRGVAAVAAEAATDSAATTTVAPFEGIMNIKAGIRTIAVTDDSFIPAPSRRSDNDGDAVADQAPVGGSGGSEDAVDLDQSAEPETVTSADRFSHRTRHRNHNRNNRRRRKGENMRAFTVTDGWRRSLRVTTDK